MLVVRNDAVCISKLTHIFWQRPARAAWARELQRRLLPPCGGGRPTRPGARGRRPLQTLPRPPPRTVHPRERRASHAAPPQRRPLQQRPTVPLPPPSARGRGGLSWCSHEWGPRWWLRYAPPSPPTCPTPTSPCRPCCTPQLRGLTRLGGGGPAGDFPPAGGDAAQGDFGGGIGATPLTGDSPHSPFVPPLKWAALLGREHIQNQRELSRAADAVARGPRYRAAPMSWRALLAAYQGLGAAHWLSAQPAPSAGGGPFSGPSMRTATRLSLGAPPRADPPNPRCLCGADTGADARDFLVVCQRLAPRKYGTYTHVLHLVATALEKSLDWAAVLKEVDLPPPPARPRDADGSTPPRAPFAPVM